MCVCVCVLCVCVCVCMCVCVCVCCSNTCTRLFDVVFFFAETASRVFDASSMATVDARAVSHADCTCAVLPCCFKGLLSAFVSYHPAFLGGYFPPFLANDMLAVRASMLFSLPGLELALRYRGGYLSH